MVHAAAAELLEHGYAGSSLSRIAARLALTKGALAHHFPTKGKLLDAVVGHLEVVLESSHTQALEAFPNRGSRACIAQMTTFGYAISTDLVAAAAVSLFADPSVPDAVMTPVLVAWHRMVSECFDQAIAVEGVELNIATPHAAEFFIANMSGSMLTARYLADLAKERDRLVFTQLTLRALGFRDTDQIVADVMAAVTDGTIALMSQPHQVYDALRSPRPTSGGE